MGSSSEVSYSSKTVLVCEFTRESVTSKRQTGSSTPPTFRVPTHLADLLTSGVTTLTWLSTGLVTMLVLTWPWFWCVSRHCSPWCLDAATISSLISVLSSTEMVRSFPPFRPA